MNASVQFAVAADCIFDGETLHRHAAVVVYGERIAQIVPRAEAGTPCTALPDGAWLAPGFVDLQVNGGGDVLFNDAPTVESIAAIAAAHRRFGTTGFLPTLITDRPEKTTAAIAAVRKAMRREPAVLGLHLEGPFLSHDRPGVHDPALIRAPTPADLDVLTAPRQGALVVTLAPEQVPAGSSRAWRRRTFASASVIRWRPMRRRVPHLPQGSAALPICSTRCGRSRAARAARSRLRWKRPPAGTA